MGSKELFPNIFELKIPLPGSPLGHLNSYLIRAKGRSILVDTGMDYDEAFEVLRRQLDEIGVKPEDLTDILVTYFHVDHVGLVSRLRKISNARPRLHAKEAELSRSISMNFEAYWSRISSFYESNGVPSQALMQMHHIYPGFLKLTVYEELGKHGIPLNDEATLSIGDYCFQVIWTPGHSPGHICLYESRRRFLIAGDHLLPTITPHVAQTSEDSRPLTDYLNSLEKIGKLDFNLALPAHEEVFSSPHKRIQQLKEHHRKRSMEIFSQLEKHELTAYQMAQRIHWDIDYPSWDAFPAFHKYLAVGETLSHLKLLEGQGQVKKIKRAEIMYYRAR